MPNLIRLLLLGLLFSTLFVAGCGSKTKTALDPQYIDAQELKLKVRELADQMLATMDNSTLTGLVAMPTSFVNMNNKAQTSAFGNLMGESLIYEFNQRAFPVREYRLTGNIDIKLGQGDFALLRQGIVSTREKWAALIVGTYHVDKEAVFVNARLVRAYDGMVLRTGQLVLVKTKVIDRLTQTILPPYTPVAAPKASAAPKPKPLPAPTLGLKSGTLNIRQIPPAPTTPAGPGLYAN